MSDLWAELFNIAADGPAQGLRPALPDEVDPDDEDQGEGWSARPTQGAERRRWWPG
ncbi:hypothetical protein ABZ957_19910 [Streptomyces sp. NPDC046316]|uniref:hypothetical protein n=1 Tax=Streptomyces sp. NPDC046316 TaxID=3154494 RepID=UPI0033F4B834